MTRHDAMLTIYDVINSGIISNELEEKLTEVANHICDNDFETCPKECLCFCQKDVCPNAEAWEEEPDKE